MGLGNNTFRLYMWMLGHDCIACLNADMFSVATPTIYMTIKSISQQQHQVMPYQLLLSYTIANRCANAKHIQHPFYNGVVFYMDVVYRNVYLLFIT